MKFEQWIKVTVIVGMAGAVGSVYADDTQDILRSLTVSPRTARGQAAQRGSAGNRQRVLNNLRPEQAEAALPDFADPAAKQAIADSLKKQLLSEIAGPFSQVAFERPGRTGGKIYVPPTDLAVYGGWLRPRPPSQEGLPVGNLPAHIPNDFATGAYPGDQIVKLVKKKIRNCRKLDFGPRISCFEQSIDSIIAESGEDPTQRLLRFTLNRAVDMVHHVMPFAGYNSVVIAKAINNFYENRMFDAIAFTNNGAKFCANFNLVYGTKVEGTDELPSIEDGTLRLPVAEFGRVFAEEMYEMSHVADFSLSAQSVLLMRALGYLGWDLASDLRWREPEIRQILIDIFDLQTSREYNEIVDSIANGREQRLIGMPLKVLQNQFLNILQELRELSGNPKFRSTGAALVGKDIRASVIKELEQLR